MFDVSHDDDVEIYRFAFDGYLRGIFQGQDYDTPFGSVSGEQILESAYPQTNAYEDIV